MKSSELKKWLKKQGCTFENHEGGSGHLTIVNPENGRRSQLPMHGAGKELGSGLVHAIKKQLGLK
jgi:mRNA interferase HicA